MMWKPYTSFFTWLHTHLLRPSRPRAPCHTHLLLRGPCDDRQLRHSTQRAERLPSEAKGGQRGQVVEVLDLGGVVLEGQGLGAAEEGQQESTVNRGRAKSAPCLALAAACVLLCPPCDLSCPTLSSPGSLPLPLSHRLVDFQPCPSLCHPPRLFTSSPAQSLHPCRTVPFSATTPYTPGSPLG